jgi:predicted Zn-dependent protease
MSELVVSGKNPAWAKDYAATLSYPENRENLLSFLNMAFDARQLELVLALDDKVLRTGDLDLMYLLGVSALFGRRPDILAGIETQLPETAGLDENRQYLYAILGANTLLNGNGTALKRYLPQITSTQYYDNIYNFYTFAGAYQVPDSVSASSRDLAEGFSSRVRDSLPDGAPSQYLSALAAASTDSTYTGYAIARFNLIQYLGSEHGYSEDDLEFLLQFYYDQGQLDQHRALLPDAVRRYPDNPLFLNDLGYTLLLEGEFLDKGASLIRRALVFDPENPFYLDSLAWYYYLIGDYATAATYLDIPKTMENMPSEIAWHIGAIYLALNDKDQARDFFLKCIEIGNDPDYVQRATEAMKLLEK